MNNKNDLLGRTANNFETVIGVIAEERCGLSYIVAINGRPIMCKIHPGIYRAPSQNDRVVVQIVPQLGIGLIVSKVEP